jgi:hypothetical protein
MAADTEPSNGLVAGRYRMLLAAEPRKPRLLLLLGAILLTHPYNPADTVVVITDAETGEPVDRRRFRRHADARRWRSAVGARLEAQPTLTWQEAAGRGHR